MDGNIYQGSPNTGYPPRAPDLSSGESNEIMPPVAPSYLHSPWSPERSVSAEYAAEQQTFNRLMDSVHKSRIEDVRIGQDTVEFCLEDVRVVQGAIEIRARIIPKLDAHPERRDHLSYPIPNANYEQPVYSFPYANQFHPQYPYQHLNQPLPQSQYSYQYPYQYPSQLPPQYSYQYPYQYPSQLPPQYSYQYPYQYPSQLPPQYSYQYPYEYLNQVPLRYQYQYPSQFPARYLYQYPLANAAGSIAGAISQLVLTANLLRR